MLSTGWTGSPSYYGGMGSSSVFGGISVAGVGQGIADPVNAITGEFYINVGDLRLNGPMPLEIRRVYGSLNQADNNFGHGWRTSYFPYLTFSSDAVYNTANTQVTTQPNMIYAAEMDGSVIAYKYQATPTAHWSPTAADNPNIANVADGAIGGTANPFNNRIISSTATIGSTTYSIYTLTGVDGSVRTFRVQAYPTGGSTSISRVRPYLQQWVDNRGNSYAFTYGTPTTTYPSGDPTLPNYGQMSRIQSSNGDFIVFNYDTYGHIVEAFTGDGRHLHYQYDAYGDLVQVTLPDSSSINYSYQHGTSAATTGLAVPGNGTYVTGTGTLTSSAGTRSINGATNTGTSVLSTTTPHGLSINQTVVVSGVGGNTAVNGTYLVGTITGSTTFTLKTGPTPATTYSTHLINQETKPGGRILRNTYNSETKRQVLTQSASVGTNGAVVLNATFDYGTLTVNGDGTCTGSTTIKDINNNIATYKYASNQITEVDYPAQNGSNSNQNSNGPKTYQTWYTNPADTGYYARSLKNSTDKRGLVTAYAYDSLGNLTSLAVTGTLSGVGGSPETATTTMTYNSTTAVTLPGGGSIIPNTLASVTRQIDDPANGNNSGKTLKTTYTCGDSSHPYDPTQISKLAGSTTIATTTRTYQNVSGGGVSANGLLSQETVASGTSDAATCNYTYDNHGYLASKTANSGTSDPNVVTNYTYDLRGEVTAEIDSAGQSTRYTYDALGNRTGMQRYDRWSNLVSWNYTYFNQNGEPEWEQGARYSPSDYVSKQYDAAGRLCQEVKWLSAPLADGSGMTSNGYATTVYKYDSFGNMTEVDDPNQNATSMTYDAVGEMKTRNFPAIPANSSPSESFTYEPGGQIATHTDVLGGIETNTYTSTGKLISSTKKLSNSMTVVDTKGYRYDLSGRVTRETLANGSYWATNYDDASLTVTRTFHDSGGTTLMTETQIFDRRGNVVSKTDVAGKTFTATYDDLNRVKTSTGPATSGNTAQQVTTHTYDAAGLVETVSNAVGERTVTYRDAEGRPTLISVINANNTTASNTGYWYSPDHQSVVETEGSGSNAITTTTWTDTRGNVVLVRHADGSMQATGYDPNGNKLHFLDERNAETNWKYDALNHLTKEELPSSSSSDQAVTNFSYNAAGELLTRAMPGGLTAKTVYDSGGRKTSDELDGPSSSVTRNFSYTYYTSGAIGLLNTITDPRGIVNQTTYDAWLRPSTVNFSSGATSVAQQKQNTTYTYDNRGMIATVTQGYATSTTGPSTKVTRGYDDYGQLNAETVAVDASGGTSFTTVSQWAQSWDGAGRRSALNWQLTPQGTWTTGQSPSQYSYQHNAEGLLTLVTNSGHNYAYSYSDNNLLQQRNSPYRVQTITARDNCGRSQTQNTVTLGGTIALSETMSYLGDSRLSTYGVNNGSGVITPAETRDYSSSYDIRGRVISEPYLMMNSADTTHLPNGAQTAHYLFDQTTVPSGSGGTMGGLGVRTFQFINAYTAEQTQAQDSFKRPTYGWFLPGVNGIVPLTYQYDAVGNLSNLNSAISGGPTQTMVWDSYNRLVKISARNSGTGDFDWTTVYDGLGRRVQTTWQPMNNGVNSGASSSRTYYYDPQVEFLELGQNNNGLRKWKVYGPDRNSVYGGQQGCGGLEIQIDETTAAADVPLNNYFGDGLGYTHVSTITGTYTYTVNPYGLVLGGYGPLPGTFLDPASKTPQWRGHYADQTNFIYFGGRYYDPVAGRFLSADPLGHAASMDLYSYCNGDPVNGFDPDGRYGKPASGGGLGSYLADRDRQFQNLVDEALRSGSVGPAQTQAQQTSNAINAIPIIGGLKMLSEGVTGYDFAAGQYLGTGDQISHAALGAMEILPAAALEKPLLGGAVDSNLGNQFRINMQRPLVAAEEGEEMVTIYRGVASDHLGYADALKGNANPIGGHSSPMWHNAGDTNSEFTSWTTKKSVAYKFATTSTEDGLVRTHGVILEDRVFSSQLIRPPKDEFNEMEVLRRGPIIGAKVKHIPKPDG